MVQITKCLPMLRHHLGAKPLKPKTPAQQHEDLLKRSIRKFVVKIKADSEAEKEKEKMREKQEEQADARMDLRMELRMRWLAFKEEQQRKEVTDLLENLKI